MTANFLTYQQVNPEVANRWRKQRKEMLAKMMQDDGEQSGTFSTNNRVANRQRILRQSRRRTKR